MNWNAREEERSREDERRRLEEKRERFGRDVRTVAATPEGARFVRWLVEQGRLFADDYQPGPMGAYGAGRRSVAAGLWRLLRDCLTDDAFAELVLAREDDPFAEADGRLG